MSSHARTLSAPVRIPLLIALACLSLIALAGERVDAQRLPSSIHPETSSAAESLLKTAASHVRQAQWDSAVELYQRAIQQFPEALTLAEPIDAAEGEKTGVDVFVNVSDYAQRRIALLPPEALRLYRARVDGEARHLFEQGKETLNPAPLRRVVDAFFSSSWGDDATELLADLAFQEGRFDEAIVFYRRLLPESDERMSGTVYPNSDLDLARVAAKVILSREAIGQRDGPTDLQEFTGLFAEAEGELAGRRGRYTEILPAAIEQDGLRAPESFDSRWPTFAGAPTRSKTLSEPVEPGALVWSIPLRTPLDPSTNLNASPPRFGTDFGMPEDDFPAFFPILDRDEVLLTDGRTVLAYPLEGTSDGLSAPSPSWRALPPAGMPTAARPTFGVERHTLTVFEDRIYARLGPSGAEFQGRNIASAPSTSIISFERSRSDSPVWVKSADEVIAEAGQANSAALTGQVAFGGAPVVDEHGVYVALLKPGTQALTWVACLDPDSGSTRWVRYVCSGTSSNVNRVPGGRNRGLVVNPELGHRLLTIGGSSIYYQTDLGAVASLDARSGRMNWLATYPRRMPGNSPGPSSTINHNPAVVDGENVIVAPEDSDRIHAFDRSTGRLLWQVDPGGKVSHVLGVSSGSLVVSGNHVWTIDASDGSILSRWPEGHTLEQGYGRGLLAGGEIYWPTRDMLYVLDLATGRPTDRPPIPLREAFGCGGGNLVAGDGYLVIAERNQLRVFCKPSRMLRYYQDRIEKEPDEPNLHYRLARTSEALGHNLEAIESLDRVLGLATSSDRIDSRRLLDAARAERFKIRMKIASKLASEGDPDGAADQLELAVSSAPDQRDRIEAELALADARYAMGDAAGAIDVLQSALDRPELRQIDLPADEHRSLRAELLVVDRLRSLVQESGPERYERFEAEASKLLRDGLDSGDSRTLAEIVRRYPASRLVPEALEAMGTLAEEQGAWHDSARAYHQLTVSALNDRQRALGLLGLARSYEAIDLEPESREAYLLAGSRYGSIELEFAGTQQSVEEYVEDRLGRKSEDLAGQSRLFRTPIGRLTRGVWPSGYSPLEIEEPSSSPVSGADRPVVLIGDRELRGLEPKNGDLLWQVGVDFRPSWSGIVGGILVAASSDRIVGIDPSDGDALWSVTTEAGEFASGPAEIFLERRENAGIGPGSAAGFRAFRIHGDRLYFLRGDRDLVCLDPIAGNPQWTYRSSAISIEPHIGLGLSRVIIQLRMPNTTVVLDSRDGRTLGSFPQDDNAGPWRRTPHLVSLDRMAIVSDGSTIVLVDLESGRPIWESRQRSALPSSPRPSPNDPIVLGDMERLLVIRGETLQRLDANDGKVLWSTPLGRFRADRKTESVMLGHDSIYVIGSIEVGLTVSALSPESGARLWETSLPGNLNETWGLGLTTNCLIAYRLGDGTPGLGANAPVVLNLIRRDSGRRVQRLVVEGAGAGRRVRMHPDGISVVGASGLWRLSGADPDR